MVLKEDREKRDSSDPAQQYPHPYPRCESRQSSCLSLKARELLLVLGQWMPEMAAESPPTRLPQLLSSTAGQGEALTPQPSPLIQGQHRGSITDPFPHSRLSNTHQAVTSHGLCCTHTNTSCHIPHKHSSATHALCVMHTSHSSNGRVF